ncbi:hypothetical protein GUJ93_ZPchr0007g3382 [Zizania palustris]|uniref:Uncharacterized protein n=1 Tax=Zizania palustris TaxID=103762 RepID=A0A8J5TE33_ZIZPA|nr:hypothetical protein GUJ93_ZPchr0007g3382 [Zizania palustris]
MAAAQAVLCGRLCNQGFGFPPLRPLALAGHQLQVSLIGPVRPFRVSRGISLGLLATDASGFGLISKLQYLVASSVSEACNNSVVLLAMKLQDNDVWSINYLIQKWRP